MPPEPLGPNHDQFHSSPQAFPASFPGNSIHVRHKLLSWLGLKGYLAPNDLGQASGVHPFYSRDSLLRQPSVQALAVVPVAGEVAQLAHDQAVGPYPPGLEKTAKESITTKYYSESM